MGGERAWGVCGGQEKTVSVIEWWQSSENEMSTSFRLSLCFNVHTVQSVGTLASQTILGHQVWARISYSLWALYTHTHTRIRKWNGIVNESNVHTPVDFYCVFHDQFTLTAFFVFIHLIFYTASEDRREWIGAGSDSEASASVGNTALEFILAEYMTATTDNSNNHCRTYLMIYVKDLVASEEGEKNDTALVRTNVWLHK